MPKVIVADGSAAADRQPDVKIDLDEPQDRYRYVCPNGHANWEPTNSHIWCQSCARAAEIDDDIDAEHWTLLDKKLRKEVPWSSVVVVESIR